MLRMELRTEHERESLCHLKCRVEIYIPAGVDFSIGIMLLVSLHSFLVDEMQKLVSMGVVIFGGVARVSDGRSFSFGFLGKALLGCHLLRRRTERRQRMGFEKGRRRPERRRRKEED